MKWQNSLNIRFSLLLYLLFQEKNISCMVFDTDLPTTQEKTSINIYQPKHYSKVFNRKFFKSFSLLK